MATLATLANVRSEGNLPNAPTTPDAKIQPALDLAVIEMGRLLTLAVYVAIVADTGSQRKTDCTKAEAILAFAHAIPSLNVETAGAGIVTSKGWDQSRSTVLSVNETKSLVQVFRQKALMLLSPYMSVPADDEYGDDSGYRSFGSLSMAAV